MLTSRVFSIFILCTCFWTSSGQKINIENNGTLLSIASVSGKLQLSLKWGEKETLKGVIGIGLVEPLTPCQNVDNCYESSEARLHVVPLIDKGYTIFWKSTSTTRKLEDCFDLGNYNWYGGPERWSQHWPIEKLTLTDFASIPQADQAGAISEPYWLNSAGAYVFVDEKVPLFINQNNKNSDKKVCFSARVADPYPIRTKAVLQYSIVAAEDSKEGHLHAVKHFLGKPTGHPNINIIERPIWSTWAKYKQNVNDDVVLKFAEEIVANGYSYGQFEIDDDWEECYGSLTFSKSKFGNINNTINTIKELNFTVSLWVHPFVNMDCDKYKVIGRKYDYFVKNKKGSDLTQWWNSKANEALHLDFTKPEVQAWFVKRLRTLQEKHGIDSFKFDAGETSWPPQVPELQGDVDTLPQQLTVEYVRMCAGFGDLIEVRAGWKTQDLPVLVRMIDKDSHWGTNNGLYTLITTLLQMNMNGYTFVLPDMVGGNGYGGQTPTAELFVRWLQANVFMPTIQFSFVPWDYDDKEIDVKMISKNLVELHKNYAPYIEKQMKKSIENGYPVNAPIWWVDPSNTDALKEDTEFLLGEDLLVAPIIKEGAIARNIYLPKGTWVDGNDGTIHEGPKEIVDYSAPINVLPYFFKPDSDADLRGAATITSVNFIIVAVTVFKVINELI